MGVPEGVPEGVPWCVPNGVYHYVYLSVLLVTLCNTLWLSFGSPTIYSVLLVPDTISCGYPLGHLLYIVLYDSLGF